MPLIRVIALCAALGILAQGCGGQGAVVMASGRDDHGLLERAAIGMQRSPSDTTVVGSVPDGTFLRVLQTDHSWLLVRTITDPIEQGWVNDHDLRPNARLNTRNVQVRFNDARVVSGRVEVLVTPVTGGEPIWVAASDLKEVGAP